ncbi:ring-cleaving dioxygenase [Geomicrobium sp. JSM 1781026]|uniref:ring-cleaving dioxygenase n=1 Tax=Geomicrobium sp. JSM 1781026 TaxID=3344580 RepID=UPI0035C196F8
MHLRGIHHVSAITAHASANYDFYTKILGLRLVKKSVNQDDLGVYHLFYGDQTGAPGTKITFFEMPDAEVNKHGSGSISSTSFRVANEQALQYWKERFLDKNIEHGEISRWAGKLVLPFQDFEGQRLRIVSDDPDNASPNGSPWEHSPVPESNAIHRLGPIEISVRNEKPTLKLLTTVFGMHVVHEETVEEKKTLYRLSMSSEQTTDEVHVIRDPALHFQRPGRGGVHHVAFRVQNREELQSWVDYVNELGIPNSGFVDRYYFQSLYVRDPNGILFELATDEPGFLIDEAEHQLGESLSLPPFLENKRTQIEAKLLPLNTTWHKE